MDLAGFTVMTRASRVARVALESWPRARGLACLLAWCPWFGMSFSLVFTTTGFFTVMTRVALESWPRARGLACLLAWCLRRHEACQKRERGLPLIRLAHGR